MVKHFAKLSPSQANPSWAEVSLIFSFSQPAGRPGKVSSEQAKGPIGLKFWKMGLLNYHNQTSHLASNLLVSQKIPIQARSKPELGTASPSLFSIIIKIL